MNQEELSELVRERIIRTGGKADICRENGGCVHRGNLCGKANCEVYRLEILDANTPKPSIEVTAKRTQDTMAAIAEEFKGKKNVLN